MHGHFGTCVSGQKAFAFPRIVDCGRDFGPGCLAHYLPRQCGQRRPLKMLQLYSWASNQRALFPRYARIVVASGYMRDEYLRAGIPAGRLDVLPLFAGGSPGAIAGARRPIDVVFLGRMTRPKGGDVLLKAAAIAGTRLGRRLTLVMAGDGPERAAWQRLAASLEIDARFPGWVSIETRASLLTDAKVAAVPSLWMEPFGLVGLEAAACGTPSIGFGVGGIPEWLADGVNGRLIDPAAGAEGFGRALAEVLGDPELHKRLSAGALEVSARLSIDAHVSGVERVLAAAADTAACS
jgi:glycosyltransferase involved in cell wall biosynthesis